MQKTRRETEPVRPTGLRLRPVHPVGWWFDGLLLVGLATITLALVTGHLYGIDLAVREWANEHRPDYGRSIAVVFNTLGQGGWLLTPLAAILAIATGLRTRSIRPLLVVAATYLLTGVTIGPLKLWTDRPAPSSKSPPEESVRIFNNLDEWSMSYPSGHVANAIVWYGVIALLLVALLRTYGRPNPPAALALAIRIVPPAIVFCTTIYLSWHWVTDSVAGLLLGLFVDRLLARVPWDDLPLPALPRGVDRPGVFTSAP